MTLVISCVTPAYAVQASDRRVSLADGSGFEDRANKAVFLWWNTTWAYTGLAELDGRRTDQWLVERFERATPSLTQTFLDIAADARRAVRQMRFPRSMTAQERAEARRLAFVGCGFTRFGPRSSTMTGFLCIISNFHVPPGRWAARATRDFSVWLHPLRPELPFAVITAGAQLTRRRRVELVRDLRVAVAHGVGPHAVARLMTRAIRQRSAIDPQVGTNVLCGITTPQPRPTGPTLSLGPQAVPLSPSQEADWFRSVNFDGSPTWIYSPDPSGGDPVVYGPMYVLPDLGTLGSTVFGPTADVQRLAPQGPFPPYRFVKS